MGHMKYTSEVGVILPTLRPPPTPAPFGIAKFTQQIQLIGIVNSSLLITEYLAVVASLLFDLHFVSK